MKNINDKINEGFFQNVGADVDSVILSHCRRPAERHYNDFLNEMEIFKTSKSIFAYYVGAIWDLNDIRKQLSDIISKDPNMVIANIEFNDSDFSNEVAPYIYVDYGVPDKYEEMMRIYCVALQPILAKASGNKDKKFGTAVTVKEFMDFFK